MNPGSRSRRSLRRARKRACVASGAPENLSLGFRFGILWSDPINRLRGAVYFELLVTVGLLVIPAFLRSVLAFPHPGEQAMPPHLVYWSFAMMAVQEALLVGMLWRVVRLNSESAADFTEPFKGGDVFRGVALAILSVVA
jgi:hypothetical protein